MAGVQTTLPFHAWVIQAPSFRAADVSTDWVTDHWDGPAERAKVVDRAVQAAGEAALEGRLGGSAGTPTRGLATSGWLAAGRADVIDRWPR